MFFLGFFKWAKPGLFFIFVLFSHGMDKHSTNLTINEKSVDGMLGSRGGRMEGADESTELRRHPNCSGVTVMVVVKWSKSAL